MLLNLALGGDITDVIQQVPVNQQQEEDSQFQGNDKYEVFASTVLGSNNDFWAQMADTADRSYSPPTLVLFRTSTQSGCGGATSDVGPHYCPIDQTIYLDETFFDELTARFGAGGGDVAEAYVIAHEVAHHVQNEFGTMEFVQQAQQVNPGSQNELSVKTELQADCFAGLWARSIESLNILEPGEIKEAMDAAAAVGDDRIQRSATGYIDPERWAHGSSEQRVAWFNRGYNSGEIGSCNTFN